MKRLAITLALLAFAAISRGGQALLPVPPAPAILFANEQRAVILNPLDNEALVVDVKTGKTTRYATAESPTDAAFLASDIYILERDDQRVRLLGTDRFVKTAAQPAFLRAANGRLYVYSRAQGVVEEIENLKVTRRATVAPFASDFETDGRTGYLAYPREGKLRTFSISTMQPTGTIDVGAVPVDIAFASGANAVSARTLAVADPSAKRVWLIEGSQSTSQAVARGFLRGLLGLGLYSNHSSEFPTGIDRLLIGKEARFAYDSSSGTLYRFAKNKATVVAKDLPPNSFALVGERVAVWENGRLRFLD